MKRTINEIYELIKQKRDNAKNDLEIVYDKVNDFLKVFDFKSGIDMFMKNNYQLVGEVNAYADIVAVIEESGVLEEKTEEELAEKDKEIEELKTRVAELQDKDWYEACIKQLEEQNDKLIKERDALQYRVSNEKINSTGIIPKPKFNIGSTVIAKTINCKVVIEDGYYDYYSNKWLYQFHAPSSVMDNDYYSTYPEDYLEEIEKGEEK